MGWALVRDTCVLGCERCADGDRASVNVWVASPIFELFGLLREATKNRQFLGPRLETGRLCLHFLGPRLIPAGWQETMVSNDRSLTGLRSSATGTGCGT
eukprot:1087386-Prymnesium_polylepis.1